MKEASSAGEQLAEDNQLSYRNDESGALLGRSPLLFLLIGLIDLPMPEKTHRRSSRIDRWTRFLLKLLRRSIAQCRM